jgi:hypothetical protein
MIVAMLGQKITYRVIELKSHATSFNGNTNGLMCHGFLQSILIERWNIFVPINANNLVALL